MKNEQTQQQTQKQNQSPEANQQKTSTVNQQTTTQINQPKTQTKQKQKQTKQNNQSDEHSNQDLQQTIDQQIAGFNIIGQDATNQLIQVNLYPKQKIFIRGKILYANFDYRNKNDFAGYMSFYQFFKELISTGYHPMRKIHNTKNNICYFAITKGGGKILQIDNDIYGDDIYANPARIILSNVNHQNSVIKKHTNLLKFQNRIKHNEKGDMEKTLILLQSINNDLIIEKYLGPRQKIYVEEKLILALSGSVKAKPSLGGLFTAKLQGPGWIFIQNHSNSFFRENKLLVFLLFFIFFLFWFQLFLVETV